MQEKPWVKWSTKTQLYIKSLLGSGHEEIWRAIHLSYATSKNSFLHGLMHVLPLLWKRQRTVAEGDTTLPG